MPDTSNVRHPRPRPGGSRARSRPAPPRPRGCRPGRLRRGRRRRRRHTAGTTPTTFHRNTGTTCSPGNPFLSLEKGDGKDINCRYIGGGLPFGEAFEAAGQANSRTFSTAVDPEDDTPPTFRLDDAQPLLGKVVVQAGSQQGQALPGAGQITVEMELVGRTAGGDSVDLGSAVRTVTATPPARTVEVPFSFDLADTVGDADLVGVSATLTTRGLHVFHGFAQRGTSTLTLPVAVAVQP